MRDWKYPVRTLLLASAVSYSVLGLTGDNKHAAQPASKPNILFIILDDVGIDQMRLFGFGGTPAATLPNIAQIAGRGVKFTNVWAMPECSPSRAAFFTGRYPIRTGVTSAIVNNHLPQEYVSQFEATLPRVLKKAGYESAIVGKYHLGNEKDPAGNCAPATRGWDTFIGNMTAGPPSIDKTAGGGDPQGNQVCGYFQSQAPGACYRRIAGVTTCTAINAGNADPQTSASRTCLQRGGLFRPNMPCGVNAPTSDDFSINNAYYVWPRITVAGPRSPLFVPTDSCEAVQRRNYMTETQSIDGVQWWNQQSGPRMLTVSYNTMHTPYQKAPTSIVPDPTDQSALCSSLTPSRQLLNNMLEGADVEIGRMLAAMGLGTLRPDGRTLATLNLSNTIVVIVGDNGSFGSTVRVQEGFNVGRSKATVYQTGTWVPLIVAGAGVSQPGRSVNELVNVTDLFQLFGDVAGLKVAEIVPPSHQLDSQPLLPYLASAAAEPVRETNFTQVGAGKFTPVPSERSWPCVLGNLCNDTLLFDKNLCEDNGGVWYGPKAATQASSCCAVVAANPGTGINPVSQFAVRNKRFKLVEAERTNCAAPLPANAKNKPFPWAEYRTKTTVEFYDLKKTATNPIGMDNEDDDLLKDCPAGQDPKTCVPQAVRKSYAELEAELKKTKASAKPQQVCRNKGDGNLDLRVNQADLNGWATFQGRGPSSYDINMDAQTDDKDRQIIAANLGLDCLDICTRADLDRNGVVTARDMALLNKQTGACDPVLCGGDLNGDGKVNNRDVRLMLRAQKSCSF
ncbi:MAG TPA: sulfatase-like hydrolase/transferase [Xanthobacteraceae bacterium]|nr:sulfatase-like hydrolase/transferase [Xanthobacteraceae bacterium]